MSNLFCHQIVLTDKLLRSWIRCPRKAWLECHGDHRQKNWNVHQRLQLDHQQKSFAALIKTEPGIGIKACQKGINGILGLKLTMKLANGDFLQSTPPLLQKISGQSIWGNFSYRPVLARQGKKTTRELRQALTLMTVLLEPMQKATVISALSVSQTNNELEIEKININKKLRSQLINSLAKLKEDIQNDLAPPLISDRRKCSICAWQNFCNLEAKKQGHLSEISGIGMRRREILVNLGINDIQDLAFSNPILLNKELVKINCHNQGLAEILITQAKVQLNGDPERINKMNALPEVNLAEGVLIYDIESDSDAKEDFLHGFLSIRRKKDGQWDIDNAKYHPMVIIPEDSEGKKWKRIYKKINNYSNWPILHYGETEAIAIKNLGKKQLIDKQTMESIENRLIDIHERLTFHWVMPVSSYKLKNIAEWLGFNWKQSNPDGARALLWWRQWKESSNKKKRKINSLKKIFIYNHDDCLATWHVANWLLKQNQQL